MRTEDQTDETLERDARHLREHLDIIETEQRRRAAVLFASLLGADGAAKFRQATSRALNTPSVVRQLFFTTQKW